MKKNRLITEQTIQKLNAIKDGATVRVWYVRGGCRIVTAKGEFIPAAQLDGAWGVRVIGADGELAAYVFICECDHVTIGIDKTIKVHLPAYGMPDRNPGLKKAIRALKYRPIPKRMEWTCGAEPPAIGKGETIVVVAGENESLHDLRKRLRTASDMCDEAGCKMVLDAKKALHCVRKVYCDLPRPLTGDERMIARLDKVIR